MEWRSSLQIKSNISALLSHRFRSLKFHFDLAIGSFNEKRTAEAPGQSMKTVAFQKGVSFFCPHLILHSLYWLVKSRSIFSEILVACDIISLWSFPCNCLQSWFNNPRSQSRVVTFTPRKKSLRNNPKFRSLFRIISGRDPETARPRPRPVWESSSLPLFSMES